MLALPRLSDGWKPLNLSDMQRLFSMFPTGAAGGALLLFRLSVAAELLIDGPMHWAFTFSFWPYVGLAVVAMCLSAGFLTPYFSILSCLIELALVLKNPDWSNIHLTLACLNAGSLTMLGPGAYSLDARIFGRKVLIIPTDKGSNRQL